MLSVKSSFLRRSGVRNAEANALSTDPPARMMWTIFALRSATAEARCPGVQVVQANRRLTVCRGPSSSGVPNSPASLGTSSLGAPRPRAGATAGRPVLQLPDGSASRLDLVTRGGRERVRRDVELDGTELAVAGHLDGQALAHGACCDQFVDAHVTAVREQLGKFGHVDDLEFDAEGVLEPLQLRQPHVDRHLAALEVGRHLIASLRTLRTAAGRLALRAGAAAHPRLLGMRARCRAQVMHLERHLVTPLPRPRPGASRS